MFRHLWLRPLARRWLGHRRQASSTRAAVSSQRRVRPLLETLEDRITPNNTFMPTTFTDGVSVGTQINTLRDAILAANNDDGKTTDTIQLQAGPYTLSIANSETAGHDRSGKQGDLNITNTSHALVIQGVTDASGKPTTIIQQMKLDRVFQINNPGTNVTFKDLIIEGGKAQDNGGSGTVACSTNADGGGILDDGGNVTLSNVVVQSNSALAGTGFAAQGGGIYASGKGSLTIRSSVIQADKAVGGAGPTSGTNEDAGDADGGGIYASCPTIICNSNLSDNVLTGGIASAGIGGSAEGGSIFAGGQTTISKSNLSDNVLTGGIVSAGFGGSASGGGVYALGKTTINASTLSGNTLTGGSSSGNIGGNVEGGGVWIEIHDTVTINASTLSDNILTGGNSNYSISNEFGGNGSGNAEGGGVYALKSTTAIIACTLSGNILKGGDGTLSNSGSTIAFDLGGNAEGGGVFANGIRTISISTSFLSGNTLTGGSGTYSSGTVKGRIGGAASGGGVYASNTATITASTLSGNTVTGGSASGGPATPGLAQGGGAYLGGTGTTFVNATIAGNQAIGGQGTPSNPVAAGGGLFFGNATTATLTNVTVAKNTASLPQSGAGSTNGGGIDNDGGTVTLVNTLVALNSASTSPDYNGAVSNSDHNLIGNHDGSSGFSTAHGDLLGISANPLNPQLEPLANNGGPTQTLALLPGSPAINAGDNNAQSVTGPFDQRGPGFPRVVGGTIDIGAFEVQSPPAGSLSSSPPPTLHTPPLLAFIDALFGGIETVNGNRTETIMDRFLGIPLFVSTYDGNGNLTSVTIFGINITFLFELTL